MMKLKNHYAWICAIWILSTLCNSVSCVVNFIAGHLILGFVFLILAGSFSFVSGILLNKAIAVYWHNKEVDWLEEIHEYLKEQEENNIEPFEEFNKNERI